MTVDASDNDHGSLGVATAVCPWCGATMHGDGERFECPTCVGGVFFLEKGVLVDSMHRGRGSAGTCISCQQSLAGSEHTSPWEDGDNSAGYVTCRHCGAQNYV